MKNKQLEGWGLANGPFYWASFETLNINPTLLPIQDTAPITYHVPVYQIPSPSSATLFVAVFTPQQRQIKVELRLRKKCTLPATKQWRRNKDLTYEKGKREGARIQLWAHIVQNKITHWYCGPLMGWPTPQHAFPQGEEKKKDRSGGQKKEKTWHLRFFFFWINTLFLDKTKE